MREVASDVVDVSQPVFASVELGFGSCDVCNIVAVRSNPDELSALFVNPTAFNLDTGFSHYRDELREGLEPAVEHSFVNGVRTQVGNCHRS